MTETYTLDELLTLAEKNKLPNINNSYVLMGDDYRTPIKACVIGAIAVELGRDWDEVEHEFDLIHPDNGPVVVNLNNNPTSVYSLTGFINMTNSNLHLGRKRVVAKVRKHFANSLDSKIRF